MGQNGASSSSEKTSVSGAERQKVHSVGAKYFSGDEAPYQDFVLRDTGSHGEVLSQSNMLVLVFFITSRRTTVRKPWHHKH